MLLPPTRTPPLATRTTTTTVTTTSTPLLTVEKVGLARPIGADDAVDLGRKRLGDGLVLVALEAIDDYLLWVVVLLGVDMLI
jgi:hypothetical protein